MLRLRRRHLKSCPHRSLTYRRCRCPVWVFGTRNGKRIRKSLDTTSWEQGEEFLRSLDPHESPEKVTVAAAGVRLIADCESRKLADVTTAKYRLLVRELKSEFGDRDLGTIGVDDLAHYRETWKLSPIASVKKLERLRTFFKFSMDRGWCKSNPALGLKKPKTKTLPTLPFTDEEIEKIVWATEEYPNKGIYSFQNGKRVKAFVNLLRYSGLRIRDAVILSRDRLDGNQLLIYTQKTGQGVWLPLPQSVVDDLHAVSPTGTYFFWSGNGLPKSAVADWQRSLAKLFRIAGIEGAHAHRFRDFFAVKLLENGVPLESVAVLLGNSVKIAEKHYAPWVKSRQLILTEQIERIWK